MPKKSSKTAHVLNLLTTGSPSDEPSVDNEQQEEDISVAKLVQKQPAAKKTPRKSPTAKAEPKLVAEKPAAMEPTPPPPAQELSFTAPPPPQPLQSTQPPVVPEQAPLPKPAVQTAPASGTPEPSPAAAIGGDDLYELVNVAELAIKEKAASVIERMNLCKCAKCRQDVIAFSLNHLPARYLPHSRAGSIDIDRYLAEHGREVTAALVKSCIKVKANPRH